MNLTIRLSVKEALPKRMHTIRFHLYEILKRELRHAGKKPRMVFASRIVGVGIDWGGA